MGKLILLRVNLHHGVKLERHVTSNGLRHADDDGDDNDEENVQYMLAYG